jgi:hypothetical protein
VTDSTTPPVPIAEQISFTTELVRVYRTMLLDPTNAATSQQHLELGARTLSAVVSTLQRVAASADDGK